MEVAWHALRGRLLSSFPAPSWPIGTEKSVTCAR
jgi:hypothetical protein